MATTTTFDPEKKKEELAAEPVKNPIDSMKPNVANLKPSYETSDTVKQAESMLQNNLASKPGAYQSQWQTQLGQIMDQILSRPKFEYDLNGDALYQQYKDFYTTQGKLAMMDTMGQAQAMTGGYGNSYAQNVGQQAYQGHLQQLGERVPELYQLALDRYRLEGSELNDRFAMLGALDDRDYDRWSDDRAYAYQTEQDRLAQENWQKEFDFAMKQYYDKNPQFHPDYLAPMPPVASAAPRISQNPNQEPKTVNLAYEAAKAAEKDGVTSAIDWVNAQTNVPQGEKNAAIANAKGVAQTEYYKKLLEAQKK